MGFIKFLYQFYKANKINKNSFYKVSYEQFLKDYEKLFGEVFSDDIVKKIYDSIRLPRRATVGSAGYDFYAPFEVILSPNESKWIPTGIRVQLNNGRFLLGLPRSGFGTKYRVQLDNTAMVIDSDYIKSDNEGHIFAKITNDSKEGKTIYIKQGEAFIQGIIVPYELTNDDNTTELRNGGFNSTGKNIRN